MSVKSKTFLVGKNHQLLKKKKIALKKIILIQIFVIHILFPCLLMSLQDLIGVAFYFILFF